MKKCNHENLMTPFCPHCGAAGVSGVRGEIIAHCRSVIKNKTSQHETYVETFNRLKDIPKENQPNHWELESSKKGIRSSQDAIEKYTRWLKWLESLSD